MLSSREASRDYLTSFGILLALLPSLLLLLQLFSHKLLFLSHLSAFFTPSLFSFLFHRPHCQQLLLAPLSCCSRHFSLFFFIYIFLFLFYHTLILLSFIFFHFFFTSPFFLFSLSFSYLFLSFLSLFLFRFTYSSLVYSQSSSLRSLFHLSTSFLFSISLLPSPSSFHFHRCSFSSLRLIVSLAHSSQDPLFRWSACRAFPSQVPGRSTSYA